MYFRNIVHAMVTQNISFEIACPGEEKEVTYLNKNVHLFNVECLLTEIIELIKKIRPTVLQLIVGVLSVQLEPYSITRMKSAK